MPRYRYRRQRRKVNLAKLFKWLLALLVLATAVFIPLVLVPFWQTGLVERFPTLIVCGFVVLAALLSFFNGLILDAIMQKERREFEFRLMQVHHMERRAKDD